MARNQPRTARGPFGIGALTLACVAGLAPAARALDQLDMSFSPPGNLPLEEVPVFIVLGFDDNRYIDGMQWVMDLLEGKKNPAGKGNPSTFDGQPIKASFYFTSNAVMPDASNAADVEYKGNLLKLWKRAVANGHEVANHTHTHETSASHSKEQWVKEIRDCAKNLTEILGVPASEIQGFRTPYLAFNQATFDALAEVGLLYEATVTHQTDFNKRQHVWPDTLHKGFSERSIGSAGWTYPGMWEIPVYTMSVDITGHPPVTGFDSSILTQAYGGEFAGMLKIGLDYRVTALGNRAPFTVGLHSDTYSDENASAKTHYDPQMKLADRKKALSDFIDYALTKPYVRFVTARQLIQWMRKPVALSNVTVTVPQRTGARLSGADLIRVKSGRLAFTLPAGGEYVVTVASPKGEVLYRSRPVSAGLGGETMSLPLGSLPKGTLLVRMEGGRESFTRMVAIP